jgi:hypothetical protein
VKLVGAINDEKLVRLGYITEVTEKNPRILECGECGAQFLEDVARLAHGRRHHPHRERMPEMAASTIIDPKSGEPSAYVDVEGDREDQQRERETPLWLDKTEASRT